MVPRGPLGMEHQSKLSGFPIIEKDGKTHMYEYEVPNPSGGPPVLFDDYRNGIYYEYKGDLGDLVNRKTGEFEPWCKELVRARKQAAAQLKAAGGSPVIWKVGANQVKAYEKAIGKMPGLRIEP